jgi:hypothetical protein
LIGERESGICQDWRALDQASRARSAGAPSTARGNAELLIVAAGAPWSMRLCPMRACASALDGP